MKTDIQTDFLHKLQTLHFPAKFTLNSGIIIVGKVIGFDEFTIQIESKGKQLLFYKQMIASIESQKPIRTDTRGGGGPRYSAPKPDPRL